MKANKQTRCEIAKFSRNKKNGLKPKNCQISTARGCSEAWGGSFDARADARSKAQGGEVGIAKSETLEATRLKVRRRTDSALVSAFEVQGRTSQLHSAKSQ